MVGGTDPHTPALLHGACAIQPDSSELPQLMAAVRPGLDRAVLLVARSEPIKHSGTGDVTGGPSARLGNTN